jgi:hypothetical protein
MTAKDAIANNCYVLTPEQAALRARLLLWLDQDDGFDMPGSSAELPRWNGNPADLPPAPARQALKQATTTTKETDQ